LIGAETDIKTITAVHSPAHAATIKYGAAMCRHLETFAQWDRAASNVEFFHEQFQKGECRFSTSPDPFFPVGAVVKIEKRSGAQVCVTAPTGNAPCVWVEAGGVAE
jgi:hypothetical protein